MFQVIIKQPVQLYESMWLNMALDIAKGIDYLHNQVGSNLVLQL